MTALYRQSYNVFSNSFLEHGWKEWLIIGLLSIQTKITVDYYWALLGITVLLKSQTLVVITSNEPADDHLFCCS